MLSENATKTFPKRSLTGCFFQKYVFVKATQFAENEQFIQSDDFLTNFH
jgi:hypothetical protein